MMESLPCSYSLVSTILLTLSLNAVLPFVSQCSASDITLHHATPKSGFRIALHHADLGKNLTKSERIRHALTREKKRRQNHGGMLAMSSRNEVTAQIQPTLTGILYTMQVGIGTPPLNYYASISTGSDLIWTQCKSCKKCFNQTTPLYDPKKSSSFSNLSCTSELCDAITGPDCGTNGCEYDYEYNSETYSKGIMATETFTFSENVQVSDLTFGCGENNHLIVEDGFEGVMGMGRGPLSLVSQLGEPEFSYCLPSIDDHDNTSTLFIGSLENVSTDNAVVMTTPLIRNKFYPSLYYIQMYGISVGEKRVELHPYYFIIGEDNGSGGVVIDVSTTTTELQEEAFDAMANEFGYQMNATVDDWSASIYDVCFILHSNKTKVDVPNLVFHFKNADLELENYMIMDPETGKWCLTIARGAFDDRSVIGNMQQRNMLIVYDLQKETLSFVKTQCDQI